MLFRSVRDNVYVPSLKAGASTGAGAGGGRGTDFAASAGFVETPEDKSMHEKGAHSRNANSKIPIISFFFIFFSLF